MGDRIGSYKAIDILRFIVFFHLISILCVRTAFGAGYQIPNQSLRAVGIAGATTAYSTGPEASYYNPANMGFLEEDVSLLETSITILHLPSIEYEDSRSPLLNGSSEEETFYLPQVHFASEVFNNFRFGFSLVYPYGLAKRWEQPYPAASAEEFSLDVIEMNPTFSYTLGDALSFGGGVRLIYAQGEVKNGAEGLSREMDGDDTQVAYNLAATYKPLPDWRIAATYRSEVNLELEGDATLLVQVGDVVAGRYAGSGKLDVVLPAVFSLATSYTFGDVSFEITWNRTFWSAVDDFDFDYETSFLGTYFDGFDRAISKDWEDSDALRFGLTWEVLETLDATLGFAIDETPVQEDTLGFELPDSDGYMYTAGLQYAFSKSLKAGISYMFYYTTSRSVSGESQAGLPAIQGEFTDGGAHAINVGTIWTF